MRLNENPREKQPFFFEEDLGMRQTDMTHVETPRTSKYILCNIHLGNTRLNCYTLVLQKISRKCELKVSEEPFENVFTIHCVINSKLCCIF